MGRPPVTRHGLAQLADRHLRRERNPAGVAGPGDYLHVPGARLQLRTRPGALDGRNRSVRARRRGRP